MRITVTLEHRFHSTPDGSLWSQTVFPYTFWQRYLEVFDHVNIIARVLNAPSVPNDWMRADGHAVSFTPVPYYVGPLQYLRKTRNVGSAVRNGLGEHDAIIMRVSSLLATCLEPRLRQESRPYGVEVVCDPYDVFAPGVVRHPLRPFFRWCFSRELGRQCAHASAAAYVSEHSLQRRYPPSLQSYSTHYSSIELTDCAISKRARVFGKSSPVTLINVGTMEQLYKAQDTLIDALAICVYEGLDLRLKLVGDGKHRTELEEHAKTRSLFEQVDFIGQLPAGAAVRSELDNADLFVMPSRTEGLPRALIEAMARGLPCIGSTVGGIPELLPPEDMVPPNDPRELATKIIEVVKCPERQNQMSARNLAKAGEYKHNVLAKRRREFYQAVKERTEEWINIRNIKAKRRI